MPPPGSNSNLRHEKYEALRLMSGTPGWAFLEEHIGKLIDAATRQLTEGDASSVAEMARQQGRVMALREVVRHVYFARDNAPSSG